MEKAIETAIDNGLDRISGGLYLFSIGLGIALVATGAFLLFANRSPKGRGRAAKGGLVCLAVGLLAIVSGAVQM